MSSASSHVVWSVALLLWACRVGVMPAAGIWSVSPNVESSCERSLTRRWLPQFDLVSLGIDDPAKLAVLGVVDLVEDVAAFRFERRDQSVKVFNAVVDHERG